MKNNTTEKGGEEEKKTAWYPTVRQKET